MTTGIVLAVIALGLILAVLAEHDVAKTRKRCSDISCSKEDLQ